MIISKDELKELKQDEQELLKKVLELSASEKIPQSTCMTDKYYKTLKLLAEKREEIRTATTYEFNIKGVIIDQIINALNVPIISKNKQLCSGNLHSEQAKLHGADMFFKLAFMSDEKLNEVAKSAGL